MDPACARIIDANANRLREALRVMEEHARFALDDPHLTSAIKSVRHALAQALQRLPADVLIRSRDIEQDVGRSAKTPSEHQRRDSTDIATAAAKRAAEALRVLEEHAKTADAHAARALEQLRYRHYEIERALAVRRTAGARLARVRLYVIITERLCRHPWLQTVQRAIDGGADCIQLREKELADRALLERAATLVQICREAGVLCVVNDRPDIARLTGADGVHLGQDDMTVAQARRIVGPQCIVGLSTHTVEQAQAAMSLSPDYIAVGPMFPSTTKPQRYVPGPELLAQTAAQTSLPVVPVGGINDENIDALISAAARCASVSSAVISAADPADAARRLRSRFRSAPPPSPHASETHAA